MIVVIFVHSGLNTLYPLTRLHGFQDLCKTAKSKKSWAQTKQISSPAGWTTLMMMRKTTVFHEEIQLLSGKKKNQNIRTQKHCCWWQLALESSPSLPFRNWGPSARMIPGGSCSSLPTGPAHPLTQASVCPCCCSLHEQSVAKSSLPYCLS